jgi:hypothetical protein
MVYRLLYLRYLGHQKKLTGNAPHAQVVDAIKSSVERAYDRDGIQLKATSVLCLK